MRSESNYPVSPYIRILQSNSDIVQEIQVLHILYSSRCRLNKLQHFSNHSQKDKIAHRKKPNCTVAWKTRKRLQLTKYHKELYSLQSDRIEKCQVARKCFIKINKKSDEKLIRVYILRNEGHSILFPHFFFHFHDLFATLYGFDVS